MPQSDDLSNEKIFKFNPKLIKLEKKLKDSSIVYLGFDKINNLQFAIKKFKIFEKELDQMMNHFNFIGVKDCKYLVKIYNCYYEEYFINLVLEYMDLGSLGITFINYN